MVYCSIMCTTKCFDHYFVITLNEKLNMVELYNYVQTVVKLQ
jgi:hypothetical protein